MNQNTTVMWRCRWDRSVMCLVIFGTLAVLLLPAKSEQATRKQTGESAVSSTAQETLPSPFSCVDDSHYFPAGHEFILQNEADFLGSQNAPPPPPGAEVGARPGAQPVRR